MQLAIKPLPICKCCQHPYFKRRDDAGICVPCEEAIKLVDQYRERNAK